jgi:hypothetical protein
MARSTWFRWLRAGVSVIALACIAWALAHYWNAYESQPIEPHLRWSMILASGGATLAAYGVLIQTWRDSRSGARPTSGRCPICTGTCPA